MASKTTAVSGKFSRKRHQVGNTLVHSEQRLEIFSSWRADEAHFRRCSSRVHRFPWPNWLASLHRCGTSSRNERTWEKGHIQDNWGIKEPISNEALILHTISKGGPDGHRGGNEPTAGKFPSGPRRPADYVNSPVLEVPAGDKKPENPEFEAGGSLETLTKGRFFGPEPIQKGKLLEIRALIPA